MGTYWSRPVRLQSYSKDHLAFSHSVTTSTMPNMSQMKTFLTWVSLCYAFMFTINLKYLSLLNRNQHLKLLKPLQGIYPQCYCYSENAYIRRPCSTMDKTVGCGLRPNGRAGSRADTCTHTKLGENIQRSGQSSRSLGVHHEGAPTTDSTIPK